MKAEKSAKPFAQEVPGTAFKFEMVPVAGTGDGAIKPFFIGKTEFTWEAFDVYVYRLDQAGAPEANPPAQKDGAVDAVTRPSKPYLPPDRGFGHEGFAAISMSSKNAAEFCKWLSEKTGRTYRLPTEDEWELACRAGGTGEFSCGECGADAAKLGEYAWFAANADAKPHAVGTKKANAWGIHDMHGNVAEWVTGRDGKPVTKGGSYQDDAEKLKVSARSPYDRAWNASDPQVPKSQWWLANGPFVGFRVVCEEGNVPAK